MNWVLDGLYLLAGALLLPCWLWKLPRAPRYRAGLLQRLGFTPPMDRRRRRLWIHCASVGEAAIPRRLVSMFRSSHPDWEIVFSTNTNTGAQRLEELYAGCPVIYMPLDLSWCVRSALRRVRPDVVILVELEFWPNFVHACGQAKIPVAIVNGRIGARSARLLGALGRLWRDMWAPVRICCARSGEDAEGFRRAGLPAERIENCGSLKCDNLAMDVDPDRRRRLRRLFALSPGRPVLVAGSTHEGEEALLAVAYRDLKRTFRELRLIIAPRHIERARQAASAVSARGLPVVLKSQLDSGTAVASGDEVIIVDTIGELVPCYALATCAFVGRSLLPPGGGQNVMEPAALGKPVLTGPYTSNFGPDVGMLRRAGAALVVRNCRELTEQVSRLLSDPERARRMGEAGQRIVIQSQGATRRTLDRLAPLFEPEPAPEQSATRA